MYKTLNKANKTAMATKGTGIGSERRKKLEDEEVKTLSC